LAVSTVPFETPLALNPAPVTVTPETLRFEFPVFVSVAVMELVPFTVTVPNARLPGFAVSPAVAAVPVPLRDIVNREGEASVVSAIDPLTDVADAGLNTALKVRLLPAGIVVEVERPATLNPEPVTETWENVRVAFPLFLSMIGCELLFPTTTLAKLTVAGVAEI